jgi:Fibronectin type III domain
MLVTRQPLPIIRRLTAHSWLLCVAVTLLLTGCGEGTPDTLNSATDASAGTSTTSTPTAPAPEAGSVTLSWVPPSEDVNGTPVTDLAGYYIHYGTSSDALNSTIEVPGAATTDYEITNLTQGTYYFTVTAYSSTGTQSAPSNIASKTI